MERQLQNKIVLVTRKTRLDELLHRHNTLGQAKFYVERMNLDFSDYLLEDETYKQQTETTLSNLRMFGRIHQIDRTFLPNMIFGKNDIVVVLGQDGTVANTLKYLDGQMLVGLNPDPKRWDGVLLPFSAKELPLIMPEVLAQKRKAENITLAVAKLNDGQELLGVNDLFIGQKTHVSARYEISVNKTSEKQSSSGIIVSTGLGSTGWLKSILAGAAGVYSACKENAPVLSEQSGMKWGSNYLTYTVREPYPSRSTGANIVHGEIPVGQNMSITSFMPENGVIFSDGLENDYLEFNSGAVAQIGVSDKVGHLIV